MGKLQSVYEWVESWLWVLQKVAYITAALAGGWALCELAQFLDAWTDYLRMIGVHG